jgi:hypothetical protein
MPNFTSVSFKQSMTMRKGYLSAPQNFFVCVWDFPHGFTFHFSQHAEFHFRICDLRGSWHCPWTPYSAPEIVVGVWSLPLIVLRLISVNIANFTFVYAILRTLTLPLGPLRRPWNFLVFDGSVRLVLRLISVNIANFNFVYAILGTPFNARGPLTAPLKLFLVFDDSYL